MNVYALFGHGCDIITPAIREGGNTLIIPPGCIYVTLTFCGFLSFDLLKLFIAFRDPFIAYALKDPITHLAALNDYFETTNGSQNDIHIHRPGDHYVDNINSFIYDAKADDKTRLFKSGIYTLGNIPETKHPGIFGSTFIPDTVKFTRGMIEDAYNGSIKQPKDLRDEYENIDEFNRIHKDQLIVMLSVLMAERPGIYYNFACRSVCDKSHQGLARQRRQLSARGKASPGTAESVNTQLRKHMLEDLNPWILKKPYYAYYLQSKIQNRRKSNVEKQRKMKLRLIFAKNRENRKKSSTAKRKGPKSAKTARGTRRRTPTHRPPPNTMTNGP